MFKSKKLRGDVGSYRLQIYAFGVYSLILAALQFVNVSCGLSDGERVNNDGLNRTRCVVIQNISVVLDNSVFYLFLRYSKPYIGDEDKHLSKKSVGFSEIRMLRVDKFSICFDTRVLIVLWQAEMLRRGVGRLRLSQLSQVRFTSWWW